MSFSYEVFDAVNIAYGMDKSLLVDTYLYLYNTSNDNQLKTFIEEWFKENNLCLNCGEELVKKEYTETHGLDTPPYEQIIEWKCPNCD